MSCVSHCGSIPRVVKSTYENGCRVRIAASAACLSATRTSKRGCSALTAYGAPSMFTALSSWAGLIALGEVNVLLRLGHLRGVAALAPVRDESRFANLHRLSGRAVAIPRES